MLLLVIFVFPVLDPNLTFLQPHGPDEEPEAILLPTAPNGLRRYDPTSGCRAGGDRPAEQLSHIFIIQEGGGSRMRGCEAQKYARRVL
jgi:hypothetical protein